MSSWPLQELHACTTFTSIERHHVGATPPQLYSPCLLIVRQPKGCTAKTVPAVPATPALKLCCQMCTQYLLHAGPSNDMKQHHNLIYYNSHHT